MEDTKDVTAESSTATTDTETNNAVTTEESATSTEASAQEKAVTEGEAAPPKKDAQARIRQLHSERERAKEEAAYWKGRAEAGKTTEPDKVIESTDQPMPKPEDFAGRPYEDYVRAVVRWEYSQAKKEDDIKTQQDTAQKRTEEVQKTYSEKVKKASEKYVDFEEVAHNPAVPINSVMAQAIRESDVGTELAYYLGKNPNEAARISQMNPFAAVKELGKLEVKLSAAPTLKKTTTAPDPITTVSGNANLKKDIFDESLSTEDRISAWRKRA